MRQIATLGVVTCVFLLAGAAGAADGDPWLKTCFSSTGAPPCAPLQPPFQAADVELSADGRHLYAAVWDGGGGFNGVRLFDVGAGGAITARSGSAFTASEAVQDLDLTQDGRNVYLAAGGQLVVLNRDTSSGALVQAQSIPSPNGFHSLAVSPDGTNVYARGPNQVTVFDRSGTGTLTQKLGPAGCLTEDLLVPACVPAVGIGGSGLETVISPDGRHVYASNPSPGGVAVFARASDGTLSQIAGTEGGCVTAGGTSGTAGGAECVSGAATLGQAWAANIDPQGGFVIVSAAGGNTIFRRDPASGRLTQTDCLDESGAPASPPGCHEVVGATGSDAAFTPDGNNVVLNASTLGLSFFRLDRGTGKLAQRSTRGCVSTDRVPRCAQVPGLAGGYGGVTVSANGVSVFAAFRGGSIASFERDAAPTCRSRSITVRRRKPIPVPLSCTDANGDAVTLAIASPPLFGTLGVINQARDRVAYTPDETKRGRETFRYRGMARSSSGPPVTVTLNILAAPAKADRKPPNTRIVGGPPTTTSSRTARFTFTSTDRGSEFQCRPDWRKGWASCDSPASYTNLRPGRHSFVVRAIDMVGNIDPSPATKVWTITR
jgi:DNA-binding beta-propeller fold protein YncE